MTDKFWSRRAGGKKAGSKCGAPALSDVLAAAIGFARKATNKAVQVDYGIVTNQ